MYYKKKTKQSHIKYSTPQNVTELLILFELTYKLLKLSFIDTVSWIPNCSIVLAQYGTFLIHWTIQIQHAGMFGKPYLFIDKVS